MHTKRANNDNIRSLSSSVRCSPEHNPIPSNPINQTTLRISNRDTQTAASLTEQRTASNFWIREFVNDVAQIP